MDPTSKLSAAQSYQDEEIVEDQFSKAQQRYGEERSKRLRKEGNDQFIDISTDLSDKFRHFQEDPWVDASAVKDAHTMFPDNRCEVLILGAGFGGLMHAVRMVQAGVRPENLRIIDTAGGFGGTWYWNRYPGLMCDVESYCYLPLLEETGYIPKHRYSYGHEIRDYANFVAEKWKIAGSAVFQTKAEKLVWDEENKEWQVELVQRRKGVPAQTLNIRSKFVAAVNGVLNWPKLPGFPGILDYQGQIFHAARWDYSITGGSQQDPSLVNLKDKRVAIIGTGASAVQIVPHLARWPKHLYVVQRTPAAVDKRDQCETDPVWFKENVTTSPGWQRERTRNFHQHFNTQENPAVNLVDDEWTHALGLVGLAGNPGGPKSVEDIPAYLQMLQTIDFPRQDRIRARVQSVVTDPSVAKKLQPWYPSWCKRPCFHDDYLQAFNQDNVTLVDTDGKSVDRLTSDSIVVGDQAYPVDVIILATGFRTPIGCTPAENANLTITGRNGASMTEVWKRDGPMTQHAVLDHRFPNLFLCSFVQGSTSPNFLFAIDCNAKNAAYILAEAKRKAAGQPFSVAPTAAAAEDWGTQVAMRSLAMAALSGCTPGYMNREGELDRVPPEEQMKMARGTVWGHGVEDFLEHVEKWRAEGNMQGIVVET
ncbi:FAD/NAD(P)-binding domain-containing protein [Mollisia scopiformis]|uniref:FAD/NAD(P)-binding domain-containing protein n=1 Tax=Mollisia scopiformis TaxID=149040 RepID=A0A132B8V1_MOLSC|nr:FAD/NAD(P)-binding domain-containing protein [Mollisia scopiformis]KUJ08304.1 FAD/NAD(P)-binding domain-containing protein [Mollisia scopiformis]